jgi:hypothetical protein
MKAGTDVVGAYNDDAILAGVRRSTQIVAAWGRIEPSAKARAKHVVKHILSQRTQLTPLTSLGVTKGGDPRHPLYLSADLHASPWPEAR